MRPGRLADGDFARTVARTLAIVLSASARMHRASKTTQIKARKRAGKYRLEVVRSFGRPPANGSGIVAHDRAFAAWVGAAG